MTDRTSQRVTDPARLRALAHPLRIRLFDLLNDHDELTASEINWLIDPIPDSPFDAMCKIRYNSSTQKARVHPISSKQVRVVFDQAQPAITPGQVLGMYDMTDTYIIGGGWID